MLLAARYLVDRLRHPRSRADEVADARKRLAALGPGTPDEVGLAIELRSQRAELAEALAGLESCGRCAKGHPLPHGRWNGGHCCGGRTADLFTDDELAALRLAGTRPGDLVPPVSDHSGCAFRGPSGCSLEIEHRPNLCVRYTCLELRDEIKTRGDLKAVARLQERLGATFRKFVNARKNSTAP